MTVQKRI